MDREINIWNSYGATRVIANRLRNKKVFIVLDDVDGEKQVKALAESHDWFGQGSRIIITSRDRHLLNRFVDNTYDVKVLNDSEALQLFSWKAFKKPHLEENYAQLSMDIVNYAQGLPLALEVFGSFLFGRTMDEWKSARDLLRKNPNAEILDKLKISYDELEDLQQNLFLDIACFFNGAYIHGIIYKLESFGYYPNINMRVLVDKSLITMSGGRLQMHDLLRKMGQKIVRCESEEPGEFSRLSCNEDVIHVLKNSTGTDAVTGIVLKLPLQKQERLNVEAFSKMKKLKMLQISNDYDFLRWLSNAYDHFYTNLEWRGDPSNVMLSNKLCIMEWWRYPLESLPTNFHSDNLVELIMRESCIKQLWVGRNSFDKLKHIDLSHSQNLMETPDLSGVPNLEKLELVRCTSLSKVHPSIGFLRRLILLDLKGCKHLKRLPDEMTSLKSLYYFRLSGCSRLKKIPDSVGNMTSLRNLYLDRTGIKKLPRSFKRLSSLESLNISNCSRLEKIPKNLISGMECLHTLRVGGSATRKLPIGSGPDPIISLLIPNLFSCLSSLREVDLSYRNLSDGAIPSDLSCLSSLYSLRLSGNKFTRIPDSVGQLPQLGKLNLDDCTWLQLLPKVPLGLRYLNVKKCPSLYLFYKQMEMWRTSNEKLRSIDCSFLQAYIDYDGKPFKILHLHPRSPLWSKESYEDFVPIACGPPLVGSRIPEWFNDKSTNSFGTIQMHSDVGLDGYFWHCKGYALFIVYEFHDPHTDPRKVDKHGNSNSTTFDGTHHPNFPNFICHFQVSGVEIRQPLVLCAPGVPSVGPNGFWVYIPASWFIRRSVGNIWRSVEASITTGSLNVEVKECGARVVRDQSDASELYQVLNTISPHALGLKSYENLFSLFDTISPSMALYGPIIIMSTIKYM
ncbi:TMV resistance protein N-like [Corylus avellana]|uniref:TMV resistance protein N-like n=1 Tax=Corylus avellana TaxID=13451 RepID=UPI00286BF22D|nr:TMV resistance protein N-like [Corylus avellana]